MVSLAPRLWPYSNLRSQTWHASVKHAMRQSNMACVSHQAGSDGLQHLPTVRAQRQHPLMTADTAPLGCNTLYSL